MSSLSGRETHSQFDVFMRVGSDLGIFFQEVVKIDDGLDDGDGGEGTGGQQAPDHVEDARFVPVGVVWIGLAAGARKMGIR